MIWINLKIIFKVYLNFDHSGKINLKKDVQNIIVLKNQIKIIFVVIVVIILKKDIFINTKNHLKILIN